jgi:hypothetical protein
MAYWALPVYRDHFTKNDHLRGGSILPFALTEVAGRRVNKHCLSAASRTRNRHTSSTSPAAPSRPL